MFTAVLFQTSTSVRDRTPAATTRCAETRPATTRANVSRDSWATLTTG